MPVFHVGAFCKRLVKITTESRYDILRSRCNHTVTSVTATLSDPLEEHTHVWGLMPTISRFSRNSFISLVCLRLRSDSCPSHYQRFKIVETLLDPIETAGQTTRMEFASIDSRWVRWKKFSPASLLKVSNSPPLNFGLCIRLMFKLLSTLDVPQPYYFPSRQ